MQWKPVAIAAGLFLTTFSPALAITVTSDSIVKASDFTPAIVGFPFELKGLVFNASSGLSFDFKVFDGISPTSVLTGSSQTGFYNTDFTVQSSAFYVLLSNFSGKGEVDEVHVHDPSLASDPGCHVVIACTPIRTASSLSEVSPVPLPAALPLLAAGLGLLGFAGWRQKG
jgi:hypothetical protein